MSAVVKLASALPGNPETNGLDAERDDLLADPSAVRAAIVWYDARGEATNFRTGEQVPTIEVRRFEPLGKLDDVPDIVRDLVLRRSEERTGRTPLPFDVIDPPQSSDAGDGGPEDVE